MYADASRILVSLWDVDDAATAALMAEFYRGLLGPQKLSPAMALQRAQLKMVAATLVASLLLGGICVAGRSALALCFCNRIGEPPKQRFHCTYARGRNLAIRLCVVFRCLARGGSDP